MPIKLTSISHKDLVHGYRWEVTDEERLAEFIARVALGQARHVSKILQRTNVAMPTPIGDVYLAATKMLTVPTGTQTWHRDGWIFQVMSWISAIKAEPTSLINTPQMIFAQKGFDGIQLNFDLNGAISAVVIFEDKATDNPRQTISNDVWPEFREYENGGDENVLVAEVTGLLEKRGVIDIDTVIQNVIWKRARRFRVSITIGKTHTTDSGLGRLFKEYDLEIPGDINRRRGETFYVDDLRAWMDNIAAKALIHIANLKATNVRP